LVGHEELAKTAGEIFPSLTSFVPQTKHLSSKICLGVAKWHRFVKECAAKGGGRNA